MRTMGGIRIKFGIGQPVGCKEDEWFVKGAGESGTIADALRPYEPLAIDLPAMPEKIERAIVLAQPPR